ncbi:GNAT family N-acetyltransferase [Candidatus Woesearchaeota archaeon]|nr:GNAT family N-acetyltransferase [Candidatus Woesearchaeota archaeon]
MKINGKRINLRTLKKSDAVSLAHYANNPDIAHYTLLPYPYRLKDAQDFIRKTQKNFKMKTAYELGIELKDSKEIIGMISLTNINKKNKNAEVGYWLGKEYWRKGMMTEALCLILSLGFRQLHLVKVSAKVMHPNIASAKFLESSGFKFEGTLRKNEFRNRKWYDELRYSILRSEFRK